MNPAAQPHRECAKQTWCFW